MDKFDPNKPVQTRDGRPARIICTDLNNGGPNKKIVALVKKHGDATQEIIYTYWEDGTTPYGERDRDLVNVPEKISRFFNVYETSPYRVHSGDVHSSIKDALLADQKKTSLGVLEVVTIDGTTVDTKFHRSSIG